MIPEFIDPDEAVVSGWFTDYQSTSEGGGGEGMSWLAAVASRPHRSERLGVGASPPAKEERAKELQPLGKAARKAMNRRLRREQEEAEYAAEGSKILTLGSSTFIMQTEGVIVVGNGQVGKTSMITRFAKGIFTNEYKKTIGVDFLEKRTFLKDVGEEVTYLLWDTAGQEEYDAITRAYYKGAGACILAFSTTDRDSFDAIESWYKKVHDECGNLVMVLVQNKVDLLDEAVVEAKEVETLAKKLRLKLYRTCVKDDLNVSEVFNHLGNEFVKNGGEASVGRAGMMSIEEARKEVQLPRLTWLTNTVQMFAWSPQRDTQLQQMMLRATSPSSSRNDFVSLHERRLAQSTSDFAASQLVSEFAHILDFLYARCAQEVVGQFFHLPWLLPHMLGNAIPASMTETHARERSLLDSRIDFEPPQGRKSQVKLQMADLMAPIKGRRQLEKFGGVKGLSGKSSQDEKGKGPQNCRTLARWPWLSFFITQHEYELEDLITSSAEELAVEGNTGSLLFFKPFPEQYYQPKLTLAETSKDSLLQYERQASDARIFGSGQARYLQLRLGFPEEEGGVLDGGEVAEVSRASKPGNLKRKQDDLLPSPSARRRLWRAQVPHLYDLVVAHSRSPGISALAWPSGAARIKKNAVLQRMVLGSPKAIMLAAVCLPWPERMAEESKHRQPCEVLKDPGDEVVQPFVRVTQYMAHGGVSGLACSPHDYLLTATQQDGSGEVQLFRAADWEVAYQDVCRPDARLAGQSGGCGLAWTECRQHLLSACSAGITCWDIEDGKATASFAEDGRTVTAVTASSSEKVFVAGANDGHAIWGDLRAGATPTLWEAHEGPVRCAAFAEGSASGTSLLATGGEDGAVQIWDTRKLRVSLCRLSWPGSACDGVGHLAWAPSADSTLVAAYGDGRVVLWDTQQAGLQPKEVSSV
ncbi:RAB23 [Symbiodinium natans]|uniref:RAB23 protein n=1 Tax=Symbiodinium natans TaxID=878477 RepID=A0A812UAJ3_9DINO|nr:RAB23 [Symbiodinium natans]